jgi:glutamate carboxypeptidase
MSDVLQFLRENERAMVDDLRLFVEQETPSTDPKLLEKFAAFLADYAASTAGGEPQLVKVADEAVHVRVQFGASPGVRPIVLLGHFDTVWPAGTLRRMPFRVEGGRAYGPGCFDMKAGLVQGMWALRALQACHSALPPVVLFCNCDEEIGSPTSRTLIEREAREALAVLVLEPSLSGALKTARKGVGRFRIEAIGRASHSGLDPESGVSAIEEVSRLVLDLHAMSDSDRTHGTSVNVGVIAGGTRYNVVAAKASAEVDLRVVTGEEAERMTDRILSLKGHHPDAEVRVSGGLLWPPMERTPKTDALVQHAKRCAQGLGFEISEAPVGAASDGNFCAAVGAAVLDGLGAVGAKAHAPDEQVIISEMPVRAALVAELIRTIAAPRPNNGDSEP